MYKYKYLNLLNLKCISLYITIQYNNKILVRVEQLAMLNI